MRRAINRGAIRRDHIVLTPRPRRRYVDRQLVEAKSYVDNDLHRLRRDYPVASRVAKVYGFLASPLAFAAYSVGTTYKYFGEPKVGHSHKLVGTVECGKEKSRPVLDQWVQLQAEGADDGGGGGRGAWALESFHKDVMQPCMQELLERDLNDKTVVTRDGYKEDIGYLYKEHLYDSQLCLTFEAAAEPTNYPKCRFRPAPRDKKGVSQGCEYE